MKFNRRARLDPSQVSDRRGMSTGGKAVAGGGIGALLIALVTILTGGDPTSILTSDGGGGPLQPGSEGLGEMQQECQLVSDVDENPDCRYVLYVNSIQSFWQDEFARHGAQYTLATTNFFTDAVTTGCGTASAQVGPFYCPADQNVYLDLGFFDTLRTQFGGSGGQFAEAYVLAHEYGHHIQNLTGVMQQVNPQSSGPESDAVRLELQADCYAGVWANNATTASMDDGQPLISELSEQDIRDGLDAARIVGDDYIQERFRGTVTPESWTHGSSEQRQRWFLTGYQSGDLNTCDTFAASRL